MREKAKSREEKTKKNPQYVDGENAAKVAGKNPPRRKQISRETASTDSYGIVKSCMFPSFYILVFLLFPPSSFFMIILCYIYVDCFLLVIIYLFFSSYIFWFAKVMNHYFV